MTLDSIITLFVNSPALQEGTSKGGGGLRRKSYFAACSRFVSCCHEAEGGEPVALSLFTCLQSEKKHRNRPEPAPQKIFFNPENSGRKNGGGYAPAFSSNPEGVFGLRQDGRNLLFS
jgi:hypothetical protein